MSTTRGNIAIIGQGYVGLPLALEAAKAGWTVLGIDVDGKIVNQLRSGISHIEDVSNSDIRAALDSKTYSVSQDFVQLGDVQIVVFCVPTPVNSEGKPNTQYLEKASLLVAPNLKSGTLVVNESTSYPGTLRDLIYPLIQKNLLNEKIEILFATAPERIDPRNEFWNLTNTPRIVSGINQRASEKVYEFYSSFCSEVILVRSPEVAELAKLLENTFRQVNIALVNQLVPFCKEIGVDIREVVEAAGSKPYGYMKFFPGAGVGGHCIPIDPLYLLWKARQVGVELPFVAKADEINGGMPSYVVSRLLESAKPSKGETIAILGVAYKAGISDVRESPAEHVAKELATQGYKVVWADPLVENFHKYEKFSGHQLKGAIVVTAQSGLPVVELAASGVKILDCTGAFKGIQRVEQL